MKVIARIKLKPVKTRKPVAKKANTVMKDKSMYTRKKKHRKVDA